MDIDDPKDEEKRSSEEPTKGKDIDAPLQKTYVMDVDDNKDEDEVTADPDPTSKVKEQVDIIVAETQSSKDIVSGIERLLLIEKKQRQAEEEANTLYIAKQIIKICHDSRDYTLLAEQIAVLCKRRSQFRRVQMRIVQQAMDWMEEMEKDTKLKLIDSLINVTEGKMFVEVERARLTKKLAEIRESEGKIDEAADILQELQIETFGSMKKREKCDFLLEQVRLCLGKRDFIRAKIIRNKITKKIIRDLKDLEQKYWNLSLILFYHSDQQFLELSKAYQRLKELNDDKRDKLGALANCIFAVVLAPYGNEQSDLLHKILENETKLLESLPEYRELLVLLTTNELIKWPFDDDLKKEFGSFQFVGVKDNEQNFESLLRVRIIEHNIRVIAKYYNRISSLRFATFLGVKIEEMEERLSKAVTEGMIFARIDRLDQIIRFKEKETSNSILNDWRQNIDSLLDLVDRTCHQITKEVVTHGGKGKGKGKGKGNKGKNKE